MSNISDSPYARRTRELNKLITQLRALGAQAEVDLPRIAVIGNQSAGKSSLVEAISGITVPRSSGTCTRCPMECRLTQSPKSVPWRCQVSLRIEFDNDTGSRLPSVREHKFGLPVTEPDLLEDVLRRAQLAILNPSVDHQKFVDFDVNSLEKGGPPPLDSIQQLQFSKNVVCLDLSGPDSTDLSFIDLPGIISNVAPGEDRNNIDVVRNLVTEHIKGNCLILLTLTMRDDIENQSAAFLAKEVDPQGHRTIGVLTKPDTLQPGEYAGWLEVLQNQRHSLLHGYYMTKQPSAAELSEKLPFDVARKREKEYFENPNNPWWENQATQKNLGTPNLTKSLSKLLSRLIDATLPKLRSDAAKSRQDARAAYSSLPPPIDLTNPTADLLRLITNFSNDFEKYTTGASTEYASLIQKYKPAFKTFKVGVRKTAPNFRPYTLEEAKEKELTWNDTLQDDDEDERSAAKERDDGLSSTDPPAEDEDMERVDAVHAIDTIFRRLGPIHVEQVKKYIEGARTRELPHNVPFSAKSGLIQRSMLTWEEHALECFKFVRAVVAAQLGDLIEKHFGRFVSSGLTDAVSGIVQKIVERHEYKSIKRIKWLMRLETRPFTQNNHYLASYTDGYLAKYKGARRQHHEGSSSLSDQEKSDKTRDAISLLVSLGHTITNPEDLERLNASDPYEEELMVMAEVRAYWQVAYKRIIDVLPLAIDEDFICAIAAKTQEMLVNDLGLSSTDASEKARTYLAEDPELAEERKMVNARLERAEDVWSQLARFKA